MDAICHVHVLTGRANEKSKNKLDTRRTDLITNLKKKMMIIYNKMLSRRKKRRRKENGQGKERHDIQCDKNEGFII